MNELIEGDRVALRNPVRIQSTGRLVPKGAQGIVGKMRTETGFIFVHFDRVIGEPCLLVLEAELTKPEE